MYVVDVINLQIYNSKHKYVYLFAKLTLQKSINLLAIIPALSFCVSTVRLNVTVPMSCRLGTVMLTQSSTCPSSSLTVYVRLSNPTTTAVNKKIPFCNTPFSFKKGYKVKLSQVV